jgi:hypothetical protein
MSTKTKYDGQAILALPINKHSAYLGATIRDYLIALLAALWQQGEFFSGKKALGGSGWQWDLYDPLVKAKLIAGKYDEDGCLDDCDMTAGDAAIHAAIEALGQVGS